MLQLYDLLQLRLRGVDLVIHPEVAPFCPYCHCIEVNNDELNVVSYCLTKVPSLVQLDIRLGDTK